MHTTLNKIKAHNPCYSGWRNLLEHLGKTEADDEPLPYVTILESNGIEDAIWSLMTCDDERAVRLFACDCAESVLHLFEEKHPNDKRPRKAIEVARRFANGQATEAELDEAWDAAWDAAEDAWDAARDTARAAAGAAAGDAWRAAAYAAWVADAAERAKQNELFIKYFG